MKSKSPFKLFSLSAREADQKGNYANPKLGRYRPTTFENPDLSGIKSSKAEPREKIIANVFKSDRGEVKGRGFSEGVNLSSKTIVTNKEIPGVGKVSLKQAYENRNMDEYGDMEFSEYKEVAKADPLYGTSGSKGGTQKNETTNIFADGKLIKTYDNPIGQMKGSPVKHNAGAAGAIGSDFSQAKNKYADIFGKSATTVGQNKQSGVGALQSLITRGKNQGGSMVGSVGQQIGNQAQQRAADAGGSTSINPFLPPPNQVAETGSYGGGGDRDMLEMNGNQINNQSIGRNTDITSQLFGSGQRASMLAMKGTPLHTEGHGVKQAHKHPTKTTTKISGKGEMPGSSYVEGDYVDEDDLQDVGLQRHIATLAQSDSEGTFIKQMPDTGPESNISTAKGFGEKIRLNNMSRPDYTSNEGDQMDPHYFLFKNTPKK